MGVSYRCDCAGVYWSPNSHCTEEIIFLGLEQNASLHIMPLFLVPPISPSHVSIIWISHGSPLKVAPWDHHHVNLGPPKRPCLTQTDNLKKIDWKLHRSEVFSQKQRPCPCVSCASRTCPGPSRLVRQRKLRRPAVLLDRRGT